MGGLSLGEFFRDNIAPIAIAFTVGIIIGGIFSMMLFHFSVPKNCRDKLTSCKLDNATNYGEILYLKGVDSRVINFTVLNHELRQEREISHYKDDHIIDLRDALGFHRLRADDYEKEFDKQYILLQDCFANLSLCEWRNRNETNI